ncbi:MULTISPECIES: putative 4-hydroxy-4-methyl-2-oxoglutarate aldolase [Ferrimonas]|uniref:putative 4-hydroxy-4-methyl-2-oxoglutarate aldolase n=1 Tax=Ferrimonas TaxID=44011 RepID=UPI000407A80F|nr:MULTISPECIES: putative 4-hydroxy-4-methyl-2-oxoglutarate aldolase [Ferrimonas]USD36146.1 putative 4-hydroxy-4-methyl-2-oxoglutarate aldolase [Ferrimonas sp. SCSIO 43195]
MLDLLPDLCDQFSEELTILPPRFRQFGGKSLFWGPVHCIRCPEDNTLVRHCLSQPGEGRVLVVDGGGQERRALLGDNLAKLALDNGWAGVVVYGYIRDVATIGTMDLGVQALGAMPLKTDKRGLGEQGVVIEIEGRRIEPGQYLYADDNGIVVCNRELPLSE